MWYMATMALTQQTQPKITEKGKIDATVCFCAVFVCYSRKWFWQNAHCLSVFIFCWNAVLGGKHFCRVVWCFCCCCCLCVVRIFSWKIFVLCYYLTIFVPKQSHCTITCMFWVRPSASPSRLAIPNRSNWIDVALYHCIWPRDHAVVVWTQSGHIHGTIQDGVRSQR